MNRGALFVVILVVVFVLIFFFFARRGEEGLLSPSPTPTATPLPTDVPSQSGVIPTIFITDNGFEPNEIIIKAGDKVEFFNQSNKSRWPASNIHPTHELYPGSGLIKCGTSEASSIFDACRGLVPGESFSFTFNEKGVWFYHDHLQPTVSGKIIVQ